MRIIDGDTIAVPAFGATEPDDEEVIRLIGIDTPERGQCGYDEAAAFLGEFLTHADVRIIRSYDRDRYGRTLAYLEAGGVDAGYELILQGYAVARYDSQDGYPRHDRQELYREADRVGLSGPCPPR